MKKWQFTLIAMGTIVVVVFASFFVGTQLFSGLLAGGTDSSVAMFRANLQRTGEYLSPGPKELNKLVWQFQTDEFVNSSPAISEEVVYFGSRDGYLQAVR